MEKTPPSNLSAIIGPAIEEMLLVLKKDRQKQLPRDPHKKGAPKSNFSLGNFYDLCGDLELENKKKIVAFPRKSKRETKGAALRRIFSVGPTALQEEIITLALELPKNFFRRDYASVDTCVSAAREYWGYGVPLPSIWPQDFLRITTRHHNPAYREREFTILDQFADWAGSGNPALMVIHGPTMIGKSYLVSQWFWSRENEFFNAALRVDCQNLSFDQIANNVRNAFEQRDERYDRLLFLDGLRTERDRGVDWLQMPGKQRQRLEDLLHLVCDFWSEFGDFTLILGIENNAIRFTREDFVDLVPTNGVLSELYVEPLSEEDAAQFLYERGVRRISKSDRLRIARHYGGFPAFLDAVAKEMRMMSKTERQAFVANLASDAMPSSVARPLEFFEEWLKRHEEHGDAETITQDKTAHPKAFLRLLSLMSGSITIEELREISERVRIQRISGFNIDNARLRDLPFVNEVEEDTFILHPAAKQFFRDDILSTLNENASDRFCSREELEAIHWSASQVRQRSLRSSDEARPWRVRMVEAFVYHVCEQILLIPDAETTSRLSMRPLSLPLTKANREAFNRAPAQLTGGQLWQIAFSEAGKFLLDPAKSATRVHGQFEAKARILTRLLETARARGIAVSTGRVDLSHEAAICWMHAGQLELALKAIRERRPTSVQTPWADATDRARIEGSILLRRGDLGALETLLGPLQSDATRYALLAKHSAGSKKMPTDIRGATKVLSRLADLAYSRGEALQALGFLSQVERTHSFYEPNFLNGQAARTFVLSSLILPGAPDELRDRARELIERNIEYIRQRKSSPDDPMTNEEISFSVLRAGLERKSGYLLRASMLMSQLRIEPKIEHREANFLTLAEYDFEDTRIELAALLSSRDHFFSPRLGSEREREVSRRNRRNELKILIEKQVERMKDHGHVLLQIDAMLLLCELLYEGEQRSLLDQVEQLIDRHGYELRREDLAILRGGRSAVIECGL